MKLQASRRERSWSEEAEGFDPQSGVVRCATTVQLSENPLTLEVGTADRANLRQTVEKVLKSFQLRVDRHETSRTDLRTLIDRFYLAPGSGDGELPTGRQVAIQVALLEALDPELRWVASEMAELYPDEH